MSTTIEEPTQKKIRAELLQYAERNQYDVSYMLHMLYEHPEALKLFQQVIPLAHCRRFAPLDVFAVAKLTGFQVADCGACLQLSIRLMLEAGVDRAIVEGAVTGEPALPEDLAKVQRFVQSLDRYDAETDALRDELREAYGEAALIDIGMVVTAAQMFPRMKRVLGYFDSARERTYVFD